MGYTDDACMTGFTRGQADRILDLWGVYRGVLDDSVVTESGAVSGTTVQTQQQQQQQPPPKPPGTGLGMLLPVLFRRNFGQKDAPAAQTIIGAASVNEDSASLYGSAIPQDPAAVFAQHQAAVAAAVGDQSSPTPDSSQSSSAAVPAPQYNQHLQEQYAGSYAGPAMPQQQSSSSSSSSSSNSSRELCQATTMLHQYLEPCPRPRVPHPASHLHTDHTLHPKHQYRQPMAAAACGL